MSTYIKLTVDHVSRCGGNGNMGILLAYIENWCSYNESKGNKSVLFEGAYWCYQSSRTMAEKTGLNASTIRTLIPKLSSMGIIKLAFFGAGRAAKYLMRPILSDEIQQKEEQYLSDFDSNTAVSVEIRPHKKNKDKKAKKELKNSAASASGFSSLENIDSESKMKPKKLSAKKGVGSKKPASKNHSVADVVANNPEESFSSIADNFMSAKRNVTNLRNMYARLVSKQYGTYYPQNSDIGYVKAILTWCQEKDVNPFQELASIVRHWDSYKVLAQEYVGSSGVSPKVPALGAIAASKTAFMGFSSAEYHFGCDVATGDSSESNAVFL